MGWQILEVALECRKWIRAGEDNSGQECKMGTRHEGAGGVE